MGQIITFYSFKGGVGRTMALANIAVSLAQTGQKVLMVDWDLEAPGLPRYFVDFYIEHKSRVGLLDLMSDGKTCNSPNEVDWRKYVSKINLTQSTELFLINSSAPMDNDALTQNYAGRVLDFDWETFFLDFNGGEFIEYLRDSWRAEYDFVFIDSRTGITDSGGICTIQMPDAIALVFTSNNQSLYGAKEVILKAQEARQHLDFDRAPLLILPIPSRFDGRTEFEESQHWLEIFSKELESFYYDWLPKDMSPLQIIEQNKLPYVGYFSFGEKLPVVIEGTSDPESLGHAYLRNAELILERFQTTSEIPQKSSRNKYILHENFQKPSMEFLVETVIDAVLETSGIKEKLIRNEQIIRLQQRFGLSDIESLTKFEDIYIYTLMAYAFDEDGLCKPRALVEFFKLKEVRDVFRAAYRENDSRAWLAKGQAIAQHRLGAQLPDIDPQWELGAFAALFTELVKQTRTPKEIRAEQKLDSLQQSLQTLQTQVQQLPSLEGVNQLVTQLSGAQTPALPAAAQESNAVELAHRLGEWFAVLEYERVPDYTVWERDYFEWAIDFPVTRRRVSRTLVRGVAGAVEMADLQDFARVVKATGADEGWLVGNRRVSKAARQAAADERAYEAVSCYTFDELIDEDADFSQYLDWLEASIKQRGVDVGYLPLACRKDELDPVSQQKIGMSTYGEEDGWIDGYVDMWLDDPAKEHLSVLGEFGTGKTWFALHYAWVALQRYRDAQRRGIERPRVPIVVPLRDYAKAVSVESLFSEFFFRKHEILKNYLVFEQLNRMGKLLLIFDGFDEMATRVDRQAIIDNFWELAKVVVPGAKAILTCRTEHFPNAIQERQLLDAELASSSKKLIGKTPQFEVLELEKFEHRQIVQALEQRAESKTVQRVLENEALLNLVQRPMMIDLILDMLPELDEGMPVDISRVYLYAVTRKMQRDITSERTFTSLADKLYFLCELSWEMFFTNQMSLNYREFPEQLKNIFSNKVQEEKLDHWRYDMMGQTMLIRNAEGDYSPAYRSLIDFFVAYKVMASLGVMSEDFTEIARNQSFVDANIPSQNYTWESYFTRSYDSHGVPKSIAPLKHFERQGKSGQPSRWKSLELSETILDFAYSMRDQNTSKEKLLLLLSPLEE